MLGPGALQRRADDARGIGKDGLVGYFGAGFHEVGKHAGHAAVGNKIGDDGRMLVGKLAGRAEENFRVGEGHVGPAAYHLQAAGQQLLELPPRHEARRGRRNKDIGPNRPDLFIDFLE